MKRLKTWVLRSSSVFFALALLLCSASYLAPKAYAADETVNLQVPTDWSGPSAGTNQTGTPYSWFYLIDCNYRSQGNQYPPEDYTNDNFVNTAYIAVNPSYTDQEEFNLSAALLEGISVKAGCTYTISLRMAIDARNANWEVTSGVAFVTLSLGGNVIIRKSFSTNSFFTLETELLVASDDQLNQVDISIDFAEPVSGVWVRLGWLKCLIRDSTGDIIGSIENESDEVQTAINDLKSELQNQTDTLVQAEQEQTSAIGGFFDNLFSGIMSLLIPSQEYFDSFFDEMNAWMEEHFGALYYPISLLIGILERLADLVTDPTPSITFPGVTIMGHTLWEDTTYTFDFSDGLGLGSIYEIYLSVVDCIIAFSLAMLFWRKLNEIERGT